MAWFKLSHRVPSSMAFACLPQRARLLFFEVGCWCSEYSPDGWIPRRALRTFGASAKTAQVLVDAGLWDEVDDGWCMRDQPRRGISNLWDFGYDRTSIPTAMRRAVIERDGYVCALCDGEVDEDDVHIDHIRPVSKGGKTKPSNLQVAHSRCNMRKGNRL